MNQKDFDEIMKVQQLMSQRLMQEQQTDQKIDVLNIIQELTENGSKLAQTEAILVEASVQGIGPDDTQELIDELVSDHLVKRPRTGYIQVL